MSRLPSRKQLSEFSENDRATILSAFARDLREELQLLKEGVITSSDGKPLSHFRRSLQRRLDAVYEVAGEFGIEVGQPKRLMDTIIPTLGKKLRDCTGEEVGAVGALLQGIVKMTPPEMLSRIVYLEGLVHGMTGKHADPTPEEFALPRLP